MKHRLPHPKSAKAARKKRRGEQPELPIEGEESEVISTSDLSAEESGTEPSVMPIDAPILEARAPVADAPSEGFILDTPPSQDKKEEHLLILEQELFWPAPPALCAGKKPRPRRTILLFKPPGARPSR